MCEKIRIARTGTKATPETRTLLSNMQKGSNNNFYNKKHTETAKEKIRNFAGNNHDKWCP